MDHILYANKTDNNISNKTVNTSDGCLSPPQKERRQIKIVSYLFKW